MSIPIKSIADLPANFDLTKYDRVKSFTAYDWHLAMGKRYALYDYTFNLKKESEDSQYFTAFLKSVNDFLNDPLSVANGNFAYHDNFPPVSEYTVFNHFCINSTPLSNQETITFCDVANLKSKDILDSHVYDYILTKMGEDYVSLAQYPVCINPYYSDKAIFDALIPILKEIREKLEISKASPLRIQDIETWCDYGLLPFFDLKLWELATSSKISYRVMADAIYPRNSRYGEETIRKTLKPLYQRFISRNDFEKAGKHRELSIRDDLARLAYNANPQASYF